MKKSIRRTPAAATALALVAVLAGVFATNPASAGKPAGGVWTVAAGKSLNFSAMTLSGDNQLSAGYNVYEGVGTGGPFIANGSLGDNGSGGTVSLSAARYDNTSTGKVTVVPWLDDSTCGYYYFSNDYHAVATRSALSIWDGGNACINGGVGYTGALGSGNFNATLKIVKTPAP